VLISDVTCTNLPHRRCFLTSFPTRIFEMFTIVLDLRVCVVELTNVFFQITMFKKIAVISNILVGNDDSTTRTVRSSTLVNSTTHTVRSRTLVNSTTRTVTCTNLPHRRCFFKVRQKVNVL
jgi:hypothetical protein